MLDLHAFIGTYDPDCITITETWLNCAIPDSLIVDTSRYCVFRKDRCSRGGGVCLIIKNNPRLSCVPVNMPDEYTGLELVAVDASDSMCMPFRLVVTYRPPSLSKSDNLLLFSALTYLSASRARFCMMGFFNLPDFN